MGLGKIPGRNEPRSSRRTVNYALPTRRDPSPARSPPRAAFVDPHPSSEDEALSAKRQALACRRRAVVADEDSDDEPPSGQPTSTTTQPSQGSKSSHACEPTPTPVPRPATSTATASFPQRPRGRRVDIVGEQIPARQEDGSEYKVARGGQEQQVWRAESDVPKAPVRRWDSSDKDAPAIRYAAGRLLAAIQSAENEETAEAEADEGLGLWRRR